MLLNAVRAHLAEFGIITAQSPAKVQDLVARLRAGDPLGVPDIVRSALLTLAAQLDSLALGIRALERQLTVWHRSNAASQRLETIPGVGSSPRRRSPPAYRILLSSAPAGSSRRIWALCRDRTRPEARSGSGTSPRWATAPCAGFSWWAPPR